MVGCAISIAQGIKTGVDNIADAHIRWTSLEGYSSGEDDFKECIRSFVIDFSQKGKVDAMLSRDSSGLVSEVLNSGNRFLQINVREYELYDVIKNGKPWENLSIGFQCRIFREPNIYNSKFWFHFSNVYIGRRTLSKFHLS